MAEYPDSIKSFTNPKGTDKLSSPPHATQHGDANDEIHAIETELGANVAGSAADLVTRLAVSIANDGLLKRVLDTFNVKNYGATGDGSTDDTTAINNAIEACTTGSIVYFPKGVYKVSSTITLNKEVSIIGAGGDADMKNANDAPYQPTVRLLWAGGADKVLHIDGPVSNIKLRGFSIDGANVATHGLYADQLQHSQLFDVHVRRCVTTGFYLTTSSPNRNIGFMHNTFISTSTTDCPIGYRFTGNEAETSNCCHNFFFNTSILYTGGAGLWFDFADNNTFFGLYILRLSGDGYGVKLVANPKAHGNYFYHIQSGGGFLADACHAHIFGYDTGNGQPLPTLVNDGKVTMFGYNAFSYWGSRIRLGGDWGDSKTLWYRHSSGDTDLIFGLRRNDANDYDMLFKGGDYENLKAGGGIIVKSPDGNTRKRIGIDNGGNITVGNP